MPDDTDSKKNPLEGLQVQMPLSANPLEESAPQAKKPETEGYEPPEWVKLKPKVREAIAEEYEKLSEAERKHLLLVWGVVTQIADKLVQEGELSEKDAEIALVSALLHDISKSFREPQILEHHVTSAEKARSILETTGYDEDTISKIEHAIIRHQGMPYMNMLLERYSAGTPMTEETAKVLAHINNIEPLTKILGEFPPPASKPGAILYGADLLALAAFADHEKLDEVIKALRDAKTEAKDPQNLTVGGLDKIFMINVGLQNGDLEKAMDATVASLRANVDRLRQATEYTSEQEAKIKETLGDAKAQAEIEGRREAVRVERNIGEAVGLALLRKAEAISERVKPKLRALMESLPEDTPLTERKRRALIVYYETVKEYEEELRAEKTRTEVSGAPAKTNDNGVHSVV